MAVQTTPPVAEKRPHELVTKLDDGTVQTRNDPWYWLRDDERKDPEIIALLEAENEYAQHVTAPSAELRETLFNEIVGRIQETDMSVPVFKGGYWYVTRTEEGKQYGIHERRADGTEELKVIFDENIEAGDGFFSLGNFDISPTGSLLAYSVDREGDEMFDLRFRNLDDDTDLADVVTNVRYGGAWSKDASVYFYTRADETNRPFQVWRHVLGTDVSEDVIVYQDDDQRYFVGVGNSKTEDFIFFESGSHVTSETSFLRATDPFGEIRVIEPRRQDVEYSVSHHRGPLGDRFFVHSNADAPNYKIMVTSVDTPGEAHWQELIAHRNDVKLEGMDTFAGHLALAERAEALARITVLDLDTMQRTEVKQEEDLYVAYPSSNPEFDTSVMRFGYSSMVTPSSVYDYDMSSGERTLLKQQPVLGGYNADDYVTTREWAIAEDGARIPLSIVQRKDRKPGGPCLLNGYGSYEISMDPSFSSIRLSLLDRGFVYVMAHVRGGGEMGRHWYEDGKYLNKRNTFTDFVAAAKHLIDNGHTTPDNLAIRGGSAGGLLIGATLNIAPELFKVAIATVPYLDVVTSSLDESIPLTVIDYEEWGNPNYAEYYHYMLSYSPYDNVGAYDYPAILALPGFNDTRVTYWDSAKWVQKLRDVGTGNAPILMKTEMGAGHGGASGRYDSWRDEAFVLAFIMQMMGIDS